MERVLFRRKIQKQNDYTIECHAVSTECASRDGGLFLRRRWRQSQQGQQPCRHFPVPGYETIAIHPFHLPGKLVKAKKNGNNGNGGGIVFFFSFLFLWDMVSGAEVNGRRMKNCPPFKIRRRLQRARMGERSLQLLYSPTVCAGR
jgi:hypothetical protein